eukprot:TRINITY_DN10788_c0_g1_i1.p1 TRINITY_DN10788_c0_g1~~TRINITY_DN10788_c0_g1_i1.p1  ORF type:complete len:414 (-),score=63.90 TRINITY_DN10788_c0_g1_i1:141-1382(-)
MGCSQSQSQGTIAVDQGVSRGEVRAEQIIAHPCVRFQKSSNFYVFNQTVALVRHADRLDRTPEWKTYEEASMYPNDTPLNADGHVNASKVGNELAKSGTTFDMIVSSPFLRCVETASRIAEVLKLPVMLDCSVGEIFDDSYMTGGAEKLKGVRQHRPLEDITRRMKEAFPSVDYLCDGNGLIHMDGTPPFYPEPFSDARVRFQQAFEDIVLSAADELKSVIVVSHGDALSSVMNILRDDVAIKQVGYCGYGLCSRSVNVIEEGAAHIRTGLPVYTDTDWQLAVSENVVKAIFTPDVLTGAQRKASLKKVSMRRSSHRSSNALLRNHFRSSSMGNRSSDSLLGNMHSMKSENSKSSEDLLGNMHSMKSVHSMNTTDTTVSSKQASLKSNVAIEKKSDAPEMHKEWTGTIFTTWV